uniref:Glycosyltransferase n=1 Tax=viral metagenome TaxID=1070528 RepID=A0A6C0KCF2_9ZZZZ
MSLSQQPNPTLFVIIIASFDKPVYFDFIKFRKLQLKQYNIPHLFVYDTEPPEDFVCDSNDFIFKRSEPNLNVNTIHPEYNPHMIVKFLRALHVIPSTYDYVVRVNLSTFINFPLLCNTLRNSPRVKYAGGHNICVCLPDWCFSLRPTDVIDFMSGTFMVFSKDVIEYFKTLPFDSLMYHTHNDDVIISHLTKKNGILITHIDMCYSNDSSPIDSSYIIYRVRHENDREIKDTTTWKKLLGIIDYIDIIE